MHQHLNRLVHHSQPLEAHIDLVQLAKTYRFDGVVTTAEPIRPKPESRRATRLDLVCRSIRERMQARLTKTKPVRSNIIELVNPIEPSVIELF